MGTVQFRRQSLIRRRILAIATAVVLAVSVLWFVPTGYYVTAPGAAIRTERMIEVEGGEDHPGRLMLLVVAAQPANLFWYLYGKLDARVDLETPQQFLGSIPDFHEYVKLSQAMMQDSQQTARAIALQLAGKGAGVQPVGVTVLSLLPQAPAAAVLQEGDLLLAVADQEVVTVEQVRSAMSGAVPGEPVTLLIRRGEERLALEVITYEEPARKGQALIGATLKPAYHFDLPVDVRIKSGQITGPSAGLMFTLTIIDKLTAGGITGGLSVAGTGTINPDGTVGMIGGARQKAVSAELAGADVFFVPSGNYEEARQAATVMEVVSVDTVYDALDWLQRHRPSAFSAEQGHGPG